MSVSDFSTIVITVPITETTLQRIKNVFSNVYFHASSQRIPDDQIRAADAFYTPWEGLPDYISSDMVPRLRLIQLTSAGAEKALTSNALESSSERISLCTSSGIHASSISQYIIAQIVNLYIAMARSQTMASEGVYDPAHQGPVKLIRGKTVGFLGYGHIARETARLLKPFGVDIIAANSSGERREDDGYVLDGTGDVNGDLPTRYYNTQDKHSFSDFLGQADILVSSLPSTPFTRSLLTPDEFRKLPSGAIFINVGRGDIVSSESLLEALDDERCGLSACALDVTDPEPLPRDHPLPKHPRVIVTPHVSGVFEGYYDAGADVLLANVERLRAGKRPFNLTLPKRGY